jgi:phthalate 4,5-dioxygenase
MDDETHARFEFVYRHNQPVNKEALRKVRATHVGPDKRHVRRMENRYLQDREEQKSDETFCGLGRYIPAHDAFAIETQGAIQDRREEHLGSTDIVIIEARKAILNAIKEIEAGREAPGLLRDPRQNQFPDFICISDFVREGEDGPAYCKRVLGSAPPKIAAE